MMFLKKFIFAMMAFSVAFSTVSAEAKPKDATTKAEQVDTYQLLSRFSDVFERVRVGYVEEVPDDKLIEYAINGMLTSLDPHSSFLNKEDFKAMTEQTTGKFGGLGIEVTMENGLVKVVSPLDDTPAFRAGLKPNDYIISLDGEQVIGMSLNEAVDKMKGKPGTKIVVTVRREGKPPFNVTIKRDVIKIRTVKSDDKKDGIGYIRISSFSDDTDASVKTAINSFKKKFGKDFRGVVLDLRNNPGGLLNQAINVSDIFLEKGEIVSTRSRNPEDTQKFSATSGDMLDGLPVVVLINDGSASASEIVAGALQDHKRAVIMGEKSFGKGSVQTIVPLKGGVAMRLTTAKYYTPSGRSIQATGIEPDITVKPAKVEELKPIFEIKESQFVNALSNDTLKDKDKDKAVEVKPTGDYQLDRAIDLLKGISVYAKIGTAK